jgi:AcrR family transcriptional regulator
MARRSDHTREELHALALNATEKFIAEYGIHQCSTRKIASLIGYTVGTLYNVFENQQDIFFQVNGRTLDRLYTSMEKTFHAHDGMERIYEMVKAYINFASAEYYLWGALSEPHPDIPTPEWYQQKMNRMLSLAGQALTPHLGEDQQLVMHATHVIWGGMHGICRLTLNRLIEGGGTETALALANSLVTHYLRGLQSI